MKYEKIKGYGEEKFRRLSGVKKATVNKILDILTKKKIKKAREGKPNTLAMEDRLLMALEYIREYRM